MSSRFCIIIAICTLAISSPPAACAQRRVGEPRHRHAEEVSAVELLEELDRAEHQISELRRRVEMLEQQQADSPAAGVESEGVFHLDGSHELDDPDQESRRFQLTSFFRQGGAADDLFDSFGPADPALLESPGLTQQFEGEATTDTGLGRNFYQSPEFKEGIVIQGIGAVMKIGGFVKADLIHDFNPIDSTDLFDPSTIPVGAPPRENTRFHARTSRLSFDTRWPTDRGTARAYIEGDFFSEGDRFRLRHAYGEIRELIVGQTWTTFTDMRSLPNTLDFEGSVSVVTRRPAQIRWTQPLPFDDVAVAIALEDPRVIVDFPEEFRGETRTESPDFVSHIRYSTEPVQLQAAMVIRKLGFQPEGESVLADTAWGFNFTGYVQPTDDDAVYYQVMFGDGIGSYRGLPDAAALLGGQSGLLGTFAWMVGYRHQWTETLSSTFTYSINTIDNKQLQGPDALHENTYLAANLLWNPGDRLFLGIEYLFGTRENNNGRRGEANRIQASFGFYLP